VQRMDVSRVTVMRTEPSQLYVTLLLVSACVSLAQVINIVTAVCLASMISLLKAA
jgi:hypothetical protein